MLSAFSVLHPLAELALASTGESHDELLRAIGMPSDNVVSRQLLIPMLHHGATNSAVKRPIYFVKNFWEGSEREFHREESII